MSAGPEAGPATGATRALSLNDVDLVMRLANAVENAGRYPYRTTDRDVTERLSQPWLQLDANSVAVLSASGELVGYGLAEPRPDADGAPRYFIEGMVHPRARSRGVGTMIARWVLARVTELHTAHGAGSSEVHAFCEDGETGGRLLLERMGFGLNREYSTLRAPLSVASRAASTTAHRLQILPWTAQWSEPVRRAHNDAFRDHPGSRPQTTETWSREMESVAAEWSFVAADPSAAHAEDAVVGYCLASADTYGWTPDGSACGYVERLGVRRAARRAGIGSDLLHTTLRAFARDGLEQAQLDLDAFNPTGAGRLYEAAGFQRTWGSRSYLLVLGSESGDSDVVSARATQIRTISD